VWLRLNHPSSGTAQKSSKDPTNAAEYDRELWIGNGIAFSGDLCRSPVTFVFLPDKYFSKSNSVATAGTVIMRSDLA
jgi:hypothetical protein